MTPKAWAVEPLGHTEYQLRKFIPLQNNPTEDGQYRQLILELWARWEAYMANRFEQRKAHARVEILKAEIQELDYGVRLTPWSRRKRAAARYPTTPDRSPEMGLKAAEIELLSDAQVRLQLDMEHRILRETKVLLDEMNRRHPSPLPRLEAEAENWDARGRSKALREK
jgi:hypothetical protein